MYRAAATFVDGGLDAGFAARFVGAVLARGFFFAAAFVLAGFLAALALFVFFFMGGTLQNSRRRVNRL